MAARFVRINVRYGFVSLSSRYTIGSVYAREYINRTR